MKSKGAPNSLFLGNVQQLNQETVDRRRMLRVVTFVPSVLIVSCLFSAHAIATVQWNEGTPMPTSRSEVAVAAIGGLIFVVGGFGGSRELEIYDPGSDRWSRGARVPRALHHPAAVSLGGRLFVVGGYSGGWNPVGDVYEYDPKADRWRSRAPLPTPRGALGAAVIDGRIHAVGGVGIDGRNSAAHEVYDPVADEWSTLAPVPTPRESPCGCGRRGAAVRDRGTGRRQLREEPCSE